MSTMFTSNAYRLCLVPLHPLFIFDLLHSSPTHTNTHIFPLHWVYKTIVKHFWWQEDKVTKVDRIVFAPKKKLWLITYDKSAHWVSQYIIGPFPDEWMDDKVPFWRGNICNDWQTRTHTHTQWQHIIVLTSLPSHSVVNINTIQFEVEWTDWKMTTDWDGWHRQMSGRRQCAGRQKAPTRDRWHKVCATHLDKTRHLVTAVCRQHRLGTYLSNTHRMNEWIKDKVE